MTGKSKNISKSPWAIAKTRFRLNAHQIAMAKELGMNPKKFGKLVPNKSEQWKLPLDEFIEKLYRKRFGDKSPVLYKQKRMERKKQDIHNGIIINFDGACKPVNPGGVGCWGFVVHKGNNIIHQDYDSIGSGSTNNIAEYTALLKAVEYVKNNNIKENIIIRGDSQLVINQIKGEWSVRSETSQKFVPKVLSLIKGKYITFQWVRRDQNKEADYLSEKAFNQYCKEKGKEVERCGCGGTFIVRINKSTGHKFLGCNRYPKCDKTKQMRK